MLAARSDETLVDITRRIAAAGGHAIAVHCDVSRREEVEALAAATIRHFGRIDTWVNNAGVSIYGRLDVVSDEDSHKLFETNFWGVVYGSLVALPFLKTQGGALINIGSEVSDAVVPLQGMYSASKHAVKGFTDALRIEIEEIDDAKVAVTLIQPTAVDTPYPQHARNYLDKQAKLPSPQIAPEKVAEAILDAATRHRRDVTVGMMAKINTTIAKIAPSLGDRMGPSFVPKQQADAPPTTAEGTLDKPGHSGQVHGFGPGSKSWDKQHDGSPPSRH